MGLGWLPPDPRLSVTIEMIGGDPRDVRDVMIIGQRLPGRCALRRKIRHQPSIRFSHAAPTGMKACWVRGWASS